MLIGALAVPLSVKEEFLMVAAGLPMDVDGITRLQARPCQGAESRVLLARTDVVGRHQGRSSSRSNRGRRLFNLRREPRPAFKFDREPLQSKVPGNRMCVFLSVWVSMPTLLTGQLRLARRRQS